MQSGAPEVKGRRLYTSNFEGSVFTPHRRDACSRLRPSQQAGHTADDVACQIANYNSKSRSVAGASFGRSSEAG